MMSEARPMTTMPVPRLMSAERWYWASTAPDSAVMALAMQRPTVMVNAVLMDDARTMSGLSPVARMDRPIRVPRNAMSSAQTTTVTSAATMSL